MHFSKEIVGYILTGLQQQFNASVDFGENSETCGIEVTVPFQLHTNNKVTFLYVEVLNNTFPNGFVITSASPVGDLYRDMSNTDLRRHSPNIWLGNINLVLAKKAEVEKPVVTAPNENERDPFINAVYDLLCARDPELKPLDQLSHAKRGVIERHIGSLYLLAKL